MSSSADSHLVAFGTGWRDSPSGLLLAIGGERYAFDLGDGCQRLSMEHRLRLARLRAVFLTSTAPRTTGGLPGSLLTLCDSGGTSLSLNGPPGTLRYLHATRMFLHRAALRLHVCEHESLWVDANVAVHCIPIATTDDGAHQSVAQRDLLERARDTTAVVQCAKGSAGGTGGAFAARRRRTLGGGDDGAVLPPRAVDDGEPQPMSPSLKRPQSPEAGKGKGSQAQQQQQKKKPRVIPTEVGGWTVVDDGSGAAPSAHDEAERLLAPFVLPERTTVGGVSFAHDRNALLPDESVVPLHDVPMAEGDVHAERVSCYVVHLAAKRGKFLAAKAKELGIPPGPMFSHLTAGKTLQGPDGQLVRPEDCVERTRPGAVVLVVRCPSAALLPHVVGHAAFAPYMAAERYDPDVLVTVVHLTPADVLATDEYRAWMARLGDVTTQTRHVLMDETVVSDEAVFLSQTTNLLVLNGVHPTVFPVPFLGERPVDGLVPAGLPAGTVALRHRRKYAVGAVDGSLDGDDQVAPRLDASADRVAVVAERSRANGLEQAQAELATRLAAVRQQAAERAAAPDISFTFTGTGSAIPSKYRNVSGVLLRTPEGAMLVDAGEGTYGQIVRHLGPDAADELIARLSLVWISHMHADHHLGLCSILERRRALLATRAGHDERRLLVVGPRALDRWLSEYGQLHTFDYDFLACQDVTSEDHVHGEALAARIGCSHMWNVNVEHSVEAFGLIFVHAASGWRFVYSGDTRPCHLLAQAGSNCDVLVHEATFDSDLVAEAEARMHATTQEALDVGNEMRARSTVLTHFSQRYPKIPVLTASEATAETRPGIAFDLMHVHAGAVDDLAHLLPSLRAVFPDDGCDEDDAAL